jgi:hypothetical protein
MLPTIRQKEAGVEYICEHTTRDPATNCWNWSKYVDSKRHGYGYGRIHGYEDRLAHRLAYSVFVGPIPTGQNLKQKCGNPRCCNPNHLLLTPRPKVPETGPNVDDVFGYTAPAEKPMEAVLTCRGQLLSATARLSDSEIQSMTLEQAMAAPFRIFNRWTSLLGNPRS